MKRALSIIMISLMVVNCLACAFAIELKKGSKGDDVKAVQSRLIELGYLKGNADGDYGKKTEDAVKRYQTDSNLEATGIVDDDTLSMLNSTIVENESDETLALETDIDAIVEKITTFPTTSTVLASEPTEQNGLKGYTIGFNDSRFGILTQIDSEIDTVSTIMVVALSISSNGAADILDFYPFVIRAIDSSIEDFDARSIWFTASEDGYATRNGVTYLYDEDKNMFVASIPNN